MAKTEVNANVKPSFFKRVGNWFSGLFKGIGRFFMNMKHEMKKVTWPTKKDMVNYSLVVFPGYVMVKMLLTNDTWYVVRNTRGVTGFVGAGNKALPLSETDFASVFDPAKTVRSDIHVGDNVRILTGLFENFTGRVTSIDEEAQRVHVVVPMLKRETDVELALDEVLLDEE